MAKKPSKPKPAVVEAYQRISTERRKEDAKSGMLDTLTPAQKSAFAQFNISRLTKKQPRLTVTQWLGLGAKNGVDTGPSATGQVFQPGTPTKPVEPFSSGQDITDSAAFWQNYENTINNAQGNYDQAVTDTNYSKAEIDRNQPKQFAAADDSAIGRGIFHSSIRDADLADIEASNKIRRDLLDQHLDEARIRLGETRRTAGEGLWGFTQGMLQKKVENAQGVNANAPTYVPGGEPKYVTPTVGSAVGKTATGAPVTAPPKASAPKPPAAPKPAGPPTRQKTTNGPGKK